MEGALCTANTFAQKRHAGENRLPVFENGKLDIGLCLMPIVIK